MFLLLWIGRSGSESQVCPTKDYIGLIYESPLFIGYWFLDDAEVSAKKWTPPDDLIKFIDEAHTLGKKVVYIGFGSIVVSDPDAMTRCVVEAVKLSDVYAILKIGRAHV